MSNLLTTDYQKIFPENLKKYKNLQALSLQFEEVFKEEVVAEIPKLAIFKNLEEQSDEVLSALAWQFVIDNWKEELDREVKIRLIKEAYWAHSKKGTKKIIEENLKKLNYPIQLSEWFEFNGQPFTFKVTTTKINTSVHWVDDLLEIINKYKNCRSILESICLDRERENAEYRVGNFVISEIEKEYFSNLEDRDIKLKSYQGIYKTIEMEVER
ncbi:phage tail protein I [Fusobacterium ulcerans]|uniref:Bacteriophage P2-related tail formation protein n=1 Tax=Fusobacterium ulcerans TaxID=861 RepID=A0AAX2JAN0_9FUSO|nr:phage tail protein I [Fusobacterium ulcerans]AVQ29457.1 phage tail protein I [Fusobacterium ulcerans]EFS27046.1 phage tail protein I [Fusobacterium ulcerans ATCC 49185]SQJ03937.1 Bacteriophage P2-related tail formation protein [Fusobacterium ulcerans]